MRNKRICSILILVVMIISLTGCQKSSERFIENINQYFSNDIFAYSIEYDNYLLTGNIDKSSKFLSINIGRENTLAVSSFIYGNDLYVDIQTLNNYIKSEYLDDEMLGVISETLDSQFSEMKYLKTVISENDIWNNVFNLKDGIIPEGDMSGLYRILYNLFYYGKEKVIDENLAEKTSLQLNSEFIKNTIEFAIEDIESNTDIYMPFFNAINSIKNIWTEDDSEFFMSEFIDNIRDSSLYSNNAIGIYLSDKINININEQVKISIESINEITIPDNFSNSYDLDELLSQPYTINEEMEINDGNELMTARSIPTENTIIDSEVDSFITFVENSNIFDLIKRNPENFKEILSESLNPLGFKEISSTDILYRTSFKEVGEYLVEYSQPSLMFSLTIENTESIDSFVKEFCNSAKPILGLNFDEYTLTVEFQDAYNKAIEYFSQGQTDYVKDGDIENIKIKFHIYMENNKIMMNIEALRQF